MRFLLALWIAGSLLTGAAHGREGWQGRPLVCDPQEMGSDSEALKKCQKWIGSVLRPDNPPQYPGRTCCGEGDAFIADAFVERDGKYYAIITRDYPETMDAEGGTTMGMPKGTEILIPRVKINKAHENGGNPSGHGIVFINTSREVLCYFGLTLG